MSANDVCPYCLKAKADSDDHVFPQFLGGRKTIRACVQCNSLFGHSFEGTLSRELEPFLVGLSASGYSHPKRTAVWKGAFKDERGFTYNINSKLEAQLDRPYFKKNDDGKITHVFARDKDEARKIGKSVVSKHSAKGMSEAASDNRTGLRPTLSVVQFNVGREIRQMAVKMCIALSHLFEPGNCITDQTCRTFAFSTEDTPSPVRYMYHRCPELDRLTPALSHCIYVQADPCSKRGYGIVRLFGAAFPFYVPLNSSYEGPAFSAIGFIDIKTFREEFSRIEDLNLPEAPKIATIFPEQYHLEHSKLLNAQIEQVFGTCGMTIQLSNPRLALS